MLKLLLAPGASGQPESMHPWAEALSVHSIEVVIVALPRGRAEAAIPAYRQAYEEHRPDAIGGHSFGGRVASMLAAEQSVPALVLLSYPLHPPGRPAELRTAHWPKVGCPALLLSGEKDPFATISLLRAAVGLLPRAQLVTYPHVAHGLGPVLDHAADRVARFLTRWFSASRT